MSGQHTPGNFHVHKSSMGGEIHTAYEVDGQKKHFVVGYTVVHDGINPEVSIANANLFASAPTLQARIESLEAEKAELRAERDGMKIQLSKMMLLIIDAKAEKAELVAAMREALEILGNDYCEFSRMDHAAKTLQAALAPAGPESGEKEEPK